MIKRKHGLLLLLISFPLFLFAQFPTRSKVEQAVRGKSSYEAEKICWSLLEQSSAHKSEVKLKRFLRVNCLIYTKLFNLYAENGNLRNFERCERKVDSLCYFYYGDDRAKTPGEWLEIQQCKREAVWAKVKVLINSGNLREAKIIIDREIPNLSISAVSNYTNASARRNFPQRVVKDSVVHNKRVTIVIDTLFWQMKGGRFDAVSKTEKDTSIYTYTVIVKKINRKDVVSKRKIQDPNRIELRHADHKSYKYKYAAYKTANMLCYDNSGKYNNEEVGFYRSNSVRGLYYLATKQYDSSIYFYDKYIVGMLNEFFTTDDFDIVGRSYMLLAQLNLLDHEPGIALHMSRKGYRILSHRWSTRWNINSENDLMMAKTMMAESYRMQNKLNKAFKWSDRAYQHYQGAHQTSNVQAFPFLANRAMLFWTKGNIDSAYFYFSVLNREYFSYLYENFAYLSEHERINIYNTTIHYLNYSKAFFLEQITDNTALAEKCQKDLFELNANTKGLLLSSSRTEMDKIYKSDNQQVIDLYSEIRGLKELLSYGVENKGEFESINASLDQKERQLSAFLHIRPETFISYQQVLEAVPDSTQLVDILKCNRMVKDPQGILYVSDSSTYVYFISNADHSTFLVKYNEEGNLLNGRIYKNYSNTIRIKRPNAVGYQNYWKIVEDDLVYSTVVLCGDGIYHLINPNILYNGEQYLINQKNISTISTVRELLDKDTSRLVLSNIQLIGRPDFSNFIYLDSYAGALPKDLPGTENEVNAICAVIPRTTRCEILTGTDASEFSVKNISSPTILHLATHGFFENYSANNPLLNSGLLLSIRDTTKEDGHLTAYEASNLDLKNTDMVVLSACETGLGTVKEGDGVWGLRRSFQVAGVNYVIMSMFKVDDSVTAQLMVDFYSNIALGQNIPLAFRNAQLSIKTQYPDPVYWGAFILIGY